MTLTRGIALIATIAAAGALAQTPTAANGRAPGSTVRLKAISSRVHSKGASLVIETTEPAAYVASQPDPLTVLLDFRNVDSSGVTNRVTGTVNSPMTSVTVEPAESTSEPGSRVRIELAQPVGHRVRSERNTIVVDFDKPSPRPVSHVPAAGSALDAAPVATVGLRQAETTTVDPIAALGLGGAPATAVVTSPGRPDAPALQTAGSATIQPPAAPAPQQGTIIGPGQPAERKYTGHPVSLDFQGADLRAVLRTFAEISGLNIVIDPKVNGTVDVALRDVPWDQALDIILKANGLGYVVDGTIVRIAPLEALRAEQDKIRELEKSQTDAGQLTVVTHQLSYAKGDDIVALRIAQLERDHSQLPSVGLGFLKLADLVLLRPQRLERRDAHNGAVHDVAKAVCLENDVQRLIPGHVAESDVDGAVHFRIDHDVQAADLGEGPQDRTQIGALKVETDRMTGVFPLGRLPRPDDRSLRRRRRRGRLDGRRTGRLQRRRVGSSRRRDDCRCRRTAETEGG